MVVIGANWEFGWNTPIKEYDLWHYPMKDFGIDELAMTPVSGIKAKNIKEFKSIEEMIDHYDLPVIICDELGETPLSRFEHPKDVLYLFSRTSKSILGRYDYPSIKVETNLNKGLLWGHQAASIIMYDRYIKWQ